MSTLDPVTPFFTVKFIVQLTFVFPLYVNLKDFFIVILLIIFFTLLIEDFVVFRIVLLTVMFLIALEEMPAYWLLQSTFSAFNDFPPVSRMREAQIADTFAIHSGVVLEPVHPGFRAGAVAHQDIVVHAGTVQHNLGLDF